MRYLLRQKFFSWGDSFIIRNDHEEPLYQVQGEVLSWGKKLSFQDMEGRELAYIRQKVFSWQPRYEIEAEGRTIAVVEKEWTLFNCRFSVDVPGPDDYEAKGNFSDHNYTFLQHDREVAVVAKKWFSLTDSYGIEIDADQPAVLLLACAIVIDAICHDGKK